LPNRGLFKISKGSLQNITPGIPQRAGETFITPLNPPIFNATRHEGFPCPRSVPVTTDIHHDWIKKTAFTYLEWNAIPDKFLQPQKFG
jgi:hypothetical protein